MSQGLITVQAAKSNFFDRAIVQKALGKERAKVLKEHANVIRKDIRKSIKPPRRLRKSELAEEYHSQYAQKRDKQGRFRKGRELPFASSMPGEPPRGRTKRLKKSILFAYSKETQSALVGPTAFPGSRSGHAPSVLEQGGQSTVRVLEKKPERKKRQATAAQLAGLKKAKESGTLRRKARKQVLEIPVMIKPRPYVGPALKRNLKQLPRGFRNIIRKP